MDLRHKNGAVAELYVATKLADKGYGIYYPLLTQSRCDLVVEIDKVLLKVQVKKASWSTTGPYKYLQCRVIGKNLQTNTPYKEGDVDYFAFTDINRIWFAPFSEIKGMTSVCLDSTNVNYKPITKYNPKGWLI